jgi:hypothetical protein
LISPALSVNKIHFKLNKRLNLNFRRFQTEVEEKMGQSQGKGLYAQVGQPIDDEIDQPESFVQTVKTQGQQQVLR